ncbi:hypothetical protein [Streptomyces sp. NPDC005012]|uniref:hypothetical protein n=1 Tax=Streptomyces sp. NPDC005012 TaxID=3154558 RepID=UPI0033B23C7B
MQLRNRREDIRAGGSALSARPWETADKAGHSHDPNEVTVQLDGVGREVEERLEAAAVPVGPVTAHGEGADGPVFVDESGRRSRRYRRIGIGVGVACAVYAVVILATLLSGNSHAPWMPVPGRQQEQGRGADGAVTGQVPADRAGPSGAPARMPGVGAAPSAGAAAPSGGGSSAGTGDRRDAAGVGREKPGETDPAPGPGPEPGPATPSAVPDPDPGGRPEPGSSSPAAEPSPSVSVPPGPDPTETAPADTTTVAAAP